MEVNITPDPLASAFRALTYCDERAVEVPWVLESIRQYQADHSGPLTMLDVGCSEGSKHLWHIPPEIAVEGIDIRLCRLPGMTFHQADIRDFVPPHEYDIITCVSTLEHIGFEVYGGHKSEDYHTEQVKALQAMAGMLKPGGVLILTLPFGRFGLFRSHVNYDLLKFYALLGDAGILRIVTHDPFHWDFAERAWVKSWPGEHNERGYGEGVPFATGVMCAVLGRHE